MRAGVYARVSSEDQQERGTIESQIEFATKYCDLHQLDIVEWYKDDGVTGTIPLEAREEGARALEDAKAGKYDILLIFKIDRLGRTARIILNGVYDLEQHGIKIRSMTEPFDTGDANGRFLLTILAGVADLERETILSRMWHGANRAARAGKWLGGIVPYGYLVDAEGYLEVNESPLPGMEQSEADIIRMIFWLTVDQRYSNIKIADYLNALGVPPSYVKDGRLVKRGKRKVNTAGIWRPSRVNRIITNPTYKGIHRYGKRSEKKREIIERKVAAIVPEDIWDEAQLVLKENQLEATRNAKNQYLLRGLIKCGCCGLTYCGVNFAPDQSKTYYICNGKTAYRGPLVGKCTSRFVPQVWIESLVWEDCVEFIKNPGDTLQALAESMKERKSQKKTLWAEREMIIKAAHEKETEKESILDLFRKRLISARDVESQLQKIAMEKDHLEKRAQELELQIMDEEGLEDQFVSAEELLETLREKIDMDLPFKTRREIVKSLVRGVTVESEDDENGRPKTTVTATYSFVKGVNGTARG